MTDDDRRNGHHYVAEPMLEPIPDRPRLVPLTPRTSTREEANRSLADVALALNQHLPAMYRELDQVRGAVNLVPGAVEARIVARLAEAGLLRASLPPMRDPADTQTVFLEKTKEAMAREVSKLASMSPGPADEVHAKPDTIARVAGRVFEEAFAAREQAKEFARLREKEDSEKRAHEQASAFRSSVKKSVAAGVLTAAILAVAGYLIGVARGHLDGVIEGRSTAPVITVPVPVPPPTGSR